MSECNFFNLDLRNLAPYALAVHSLMGFWTFSNPYIFPRDNLFENIEN